MARRATAWAIALLLTAATPAEADFWSDLEEALGLVSREKQADEADGSVVIRTPAKPVGAGAARSAPAAAAAPAGPGAAAAAGPGAAAGGTGTKGGKSGESGATDTAGSAGADLGASVGGALDGAADALR